MLLHFSGGQLFCPIALKEKIDKLPETELNIVRWGGWLPPFIVLTAREEQSRGRVFGESL